MKEHFLRWKNSLRNKRKDYFIGDYLNETSDVFEKATIELTYNFIRFILLMEIFYFQMISKKHLYYHYTVNSISMVLLILLLFLLKKSKNVMLVTKLTLLVFTLNCITIFILQEYQIEVFGILFITANILFAFITLGKKYGRVIFFISLVELFLFGTNEHEAGSFIFFHIPPDQKIVQNLLLIFPPLTLNVYLISKFVETKTSAEAQIIVQKILLEEKNKDITDSIDYAKTIQKAILPSPEFKNQLFQNSFILFKPKDIVSGDFYWFTEKDGKKIIAACDCTGHGVPGALMSMVGNNILNQIVNEKGITAPNEILNNLHKEVRKTLKQAEQNETKDGMDIALITFNSETEVEFAGAQRPLWIIAPPGLPEGEENQRTNQASIASANSSPSGRLGGASLIEIKGDKFSIGGLQSESERTFTDHHISLTKGDCIYISSDGFADQFSDTDNKLMKSRFKELLLSIQQKSMPEQEVFLSDFIEKWRGKREQIDDILVIGIRI